MEIQPPQSRKCNECGKTFSLNLFSRDKECCRYCETGNIPPKESFVVNTKDSQQNSLNQKNQNVDIGLNLQLKEDYENKYSKEVDQN